MWVAESSAVTKAQASTVWNRWIDVASWSYWDKSLKSAKLTGSFKVGAKGNVVPVRGPQGDFTVVEVTSDKSFAIRSRILLTNFTWIHTLEEVEGGYKITHKIEARGILSLITGPLFGNAFAKGQRRSVEMLARQAEVDELKAQDELRISQQYSRQVQP
jgi:hypothetical protein